MRSIFFFCFVFTAFSAAVCAQAIAVSDDRSAVEIYLAKDDGTGNAGKESSEFLPTDVPIYCVVQLGSPDPVTVKMTLFAVNVPGVKAETKVVSTTYTTKNGQDRVNFTGHPHGKWIAGKYRVDIFVEDEKAGSLSFTVVKSPQAKPIQPMAILPPEVNN